MSDSQVEIPHLSNMGAAPVTVHLITLGPMLSLGTTQCHAARIARTYTHIQIHTHKIKMNFLATYGGRGWMMMMAVEVWMGLRLVQGETDGRGE